MTKPAEGLADRLVAAAVEVVESGGPTGLTFRRVAQAVGGSYGAPIARFGDGAGLLAAVAEGGFLLLERELATSPSAGSSPPPSTPSAVTTLGLRYVGFALRHRNLHRAMYHPDLQSPVPTRAAPSPSIARRTARSAEWRRRMETARAACFAHFANAVSRGKAAGILADGPTGEIAQVVTALADGFILQAADEAVRPAGGLERRLAAAARLFGRLESGIQAASHLPVNNLLVDRS